MNWKVIGAFGLGALLGTALTARGAPSLTGMGHRQQGAGCPIPVREEAPRPVREDDEMERQRAFETMMRYSADHAYGMKGADE